MLRFKKFKPKDFPSAILLSIELDYIKNQFLSDYILYDFEITSKLIDYYGFYCKKKYNTWETRRGKRRRICKPIFKLKIIQLCIKIFLEAYYTPPEYVFGFVKGRSVRENARMHLGQKTIIKLDLLNFFDNVNAEHLEKSLDKLITDYSKDKIIPHIIKLCLFNNRLPIGSPSSPILSNIALYDLDQTLYNYCTKNKIVYSRFVDDLTFSFSSELDPKRLIIELCSLIKDSKHTVNSNKIRILNKNNVQAVTGVVLNEKINLSKRYRKDIRYWLHCWAKFGLDATQDNFSSHYRKKKGYVRNKKIIDFRKYLRGKIDYFGHICGKDNPFYYKSNLLYLQLAKYGRK